MIATSAPLSPAALADLGTLQLGARMGNIIFASPAPALRVAPVQDNISGGLVLFNLEQLTAPAVGYDGSDRTRVPRSPVVIDQVAFDFRSRTPVVLPSAQNCGLSSDAPMRTETLFRHPAGYAAAVVSHRAGLHLLVQRESCDTWEVFVVEGDLRRVFCLGDRVLIHHFTPKETLSWLDGDTLALAFDRFDESSIHPEVDGSISIRAQEGTSGSSYVIGADGRVAEPVEYPSVGTERILKGVVAGADHIICYEDPGLEIVRPYPGGFTAVPIPRLNSAEYSADVPRFLDATFIGTESVGAILVAEYLVDQKVLYLYDGEEWFTYLIAGGAYVEKAYSDDNRAVLLPYTEEWIPTGATPNWRLGRFDKASGCITQLAPIGYSSAILCGMKPLDDGPLIVEFKTTGMRKESYIYSQGELHSMGHDLLAVKDVQKSGNKLFWRGMDKSGVYQLHSASIPACEVTPSPYDFGGSVHWFKISDDGLTMAVLVRNKGYFTFHLMDMD